MPTQCNNNLDILIFSIPSQGNVYTLSELVDENGFVKILVATLERKVIYFKLFISSYTERSVSL